jgi:pimeloyl-ACP methyl ester carboxylesterase
MPEFHTDDRVRLHYTLRGCGRLTLMYLHDLGGDAGTWKALWEAIDHPRFCHVALDLRGHGGSQRMPSAFCVDRLASDVLQLADRLELPRLVLVGHGFGGQVALRVATRSLGRIAGLVLMGPVGPDAPPFGRETVEHLVKCGDNVDQLRAHFRPWFKEWPRPELDRWIANLANTPTWVRREFGREGQIASDRPEVLVADIPAIVIAGEDDPVCGPTYQHAAVMPALSNACLLIVPCGHGLLLERPDEIAMHCGRFFSRLE